MFVLDDSPKGFLDDMMKCVCEKEMEYASILGVIYIEKQKDCLDQLYCFYVQGVRRAQYSIPMITRSVCKYEGVYGPVFTVKCDDHRY